jgi:glucose/arabinose dehydrogenase
MKMLPKILIIILCFAFFILHHTATDATVVPNIENLQLRKAFPNLTFNRPVDLQDPRDGTNRLFVIEQTGKIYVFENKQNVTLKSVFLDITERVESSGNEQGLLGMAFHPDFKNNGYFYVDYTADNPDRTVISRFSTVIGNQTIANPDSELVLLEVDQPFANHNGGQIQFGPDGYLYIALGDGGSGGDPQGHGQNRSTLLGSILRIDVDNVESGKNYGIPNDNPFYNNVNEFKEEIFAYGLRNPWRFSFDPVTGWLWVGDVGQNNIEEISVIEKGKNYGWNIMEGSSCYQPSTGCDDTGLEYPIHEYDHPIGFVITGGYVYRGLQVPEIIGGYIYADYSSGLIWSLNYDGSKVSNQEILNTDLNIASFGTDKNNELYICAFDGSIYEFQNTTTVLPTSTNGTISSTSSDQGNDSTTSDSNNLSIRFVIVLNSGIMVILFKHYKSKNIKP